MIADTATESALAGLDPTHTAAFVALCPAIANAVADLLAEIRSSHGLPPEILAALVVRATVVELASSIATNAALGIDGPDVEQACRWLRHAVAHMSAAATRAPSTIQ